MPTIYLCNDQLTLQVLLTIVMLRDVLTNVLMTMKLKTTDVPALQTYTFPMMTGLVDKLSQMYPLLLSHQLLFNYFLLIAYGQNGQIGAHAQPPVENQQ